MDIQQIKVNELPLAATLTGLEVLGFNASTNEAVRAAISLLEGLDGKPIELQKTTTHIQWRIQGGAWSNLIALSDIKGDKGDKGDVGTPNSLSIGTVTSGSTPSATISGLSPSQTLNLTLPKGDIGPKGDKGDTGAKGEKGDTGAKGEKGDTGAKGEKGDTGPSNTLSIGTVTGGIDASASITGIAPNQTLNLTLPKGDKGDKGDPFEFNDLTPEQKAELKGDKGDTGDKGWTPLYAEEADNNRIVRKLTDYIGGEGTKPATNLNQYLKSDGTFTSIKSEAMDVRVTGGTLPAGGTTGQTLIKKSGTDFDTEWGDGGGSGFISLNGNSFYKTRLSLLDFKRNYVKNDFTVIKRFACNTSAYDSDFITVSNENNDKILINNEGYNFKIQLYKANVKIFELTEASNIIFNIVAKITLFVEVDFTLNEIRISYSGYNRTISIPELAQLKDVIFTKYTPAIYNYSGGCRDWYLLDGLFDFASRNLVFSESSDNSFIRSELLSKSFDVVIQNPATVKLTTILKSFVNGKATFDAQADNIPLSPSAGFRYGVINAANELLYELSSIDVNVGSLTFNKGTVATNFIFRAINKDTGEVTTVKNGSGNLTIQQGRYFFESLFYSSSPADYRYFVSSISSDANFTLYDDVIIRKSTIIAMAIPESANFDGIYDFAQDNIINSKINLLKTY